MTAFHFQHQYCLGMAIKACIFDLDGVLVYVHKFHYIAWKKIADELHVEFNTELHKQFKGQHREACLDKLIEWTGKEFNDDEKKHLLEKKSRLFSNGLSTLGPDKVFPGVLSFLKQLKREGIKIGLSSVGYHAKKVLRLIGLTHYFDHIVDGQSHSFSNIDKQIFIENAEHFEITPEECLVFEDSPEGTRTAKEAGMKVVGIGDPSELTDTDRTVLSFEGLDIKFLEQF